MNAEHGSVRFGHGDGKSATNGEDRPRVIAQRDIGSQLRILIIDDCTLNRENLAAVLAMNGIPMPSVAWDLPSAIGALEGDDPDIVLVSVATRGSDLLLRAATSGIPGGRVIVLGASEDDESEIVACAEAGVAGFHMRPDSFEDLLRLIGRVADGETPYTRKISSMLLRRIASRSGLHRPMGRAPDLTTRETQILTMLELGCSNQDIATQLSIAVHTVKNHVHSVLTKLGVGSRAEAAALSRTGRRPMWTQTN